MKKLNELDDGSCGTIVAITGDSHFQSRITSIGLTIGSRIEVIQNPKKQPVLLYNRDTMVALNKNEAEKIMDASDNTADIWLPVYCGRDLLSVFL